MSEAKFFLRQGGFRPYFDNLDSFPEVDQVRRGVETHAEAAGGEGGGKHGAHRAFAVGAGDVDAAEQPLRMAKIPGVRLHGIQPRLVSRAAEAGITHAAVPLVQRLNYRRIIHQSQLSK